MNSTTPPTDRQSSVVPVTDGLQYGEPPKGSDIPPDTWLRILEFLAAEATRYEYFWPCWCRICKQFLRRLAGYSIGPGGPQSGTVFYRLYDIYLTAGGSPSTYEPWPPAGRKPA